MKTNKGTFIFQIAVAIYLATTIFDVSMFGYMVLFRVLLKVLRYMAYLLLIWKLIEDNHYETRQMVIYGTGVLISLISYRVTGEKLLFFTFLFLMAVSNVYFDDVLKISLWTNGICMLCIILSYKIGLIPERFGEGVRNRHSFGFIFPSLGSNYWLYFILIYISYRREKMKIFEGIILEGIAYYLYILADTKSAFGVSTLALISAYILKIWKGKNGRSVLSFFIKHITIIGTFVFCLLVLLWGKVEMVTITLNELVTGRIGLTYQAVQTYGIRLFGQSIEWVGGMTEYDTVQKAYNYVDSSYMQIMLSYGIVILFILIMSYSALGREIVKAEKWYMGTAIMLGALHSTFDPQFLLIQYNIFLLALGYLMISDKMERRKYLFGLAKEDRIE